MIYSFNIPENIYKKILIFSKDKSVSHNIKLAGNIKEQYSLSMYSKEVEPFIVSELFKIKDLLNYFQKLNILYPSNARLVLSDFWVNYQKKYEFNPVHNHSGIFSFIFFIKIPYLAEEQKIVSPGKNSSYDRSGKLSFFHLDSSQSGGIKETCLDVDQKWEQTGLIFKSDLNHCVFPFYTEGERITISGNLSLYNGID